MAGKVLAVLLTACLLLTGCRKESAAPAPAPEPAISTAPLPDKPPPEEPQSIVLDRLTVEMVVDWEDADRVLGKLEDMSQLLEKALAVFDCTVEEPVTITIGTAGGITAQALGDGGVDAAFLPVQDLSEMESGKAVQILESSDRALAAAVTCLREDQRFCTVLAQALTEAEEGREFIETCYPGAVFSPAEQGAPEG